MKTYIYVGQFGLNEQADPFMKSLKKVLSLFYGNVVDYESQEQEGLLTTPLNLQNREIDFRIDSALIICPQHFFLNEKKFEKLQHRDNSIVTSCHTVPIGSTLLSYFVPSSPQFSAKLSWGRIAQYMSHVFDYIAEGSGKERSKYFKKNRENIINFLLLCEWEKKLPDISKKWKDLSGHDKRRRECAIKLISTCNALK